jgi:hypothetical protein
MTPEQRPPVNDGLYVWVPRVILIRRFYCFYPLFLTQKMLVYLTTKVTRSCDSTNCRRTRRASPSESSPRPRSSCHYRATPSRSRRSFIRFQFLQLFTSSFYLKKLFCTAFMCLQFVKSTHGPLINFFVKLTTCTVANFNKFFENHFLLIVFWTAFNC